MNSLFESYSTVGRDVCGAGGLDPLEAPRATQKALKESLFGVQMIHKICKQFDSM